MKNNYPKTAEQYILKRIYNLEAENKSLKQANDYKKDRVERLENTLDRRTKDIEFLVSLLHIEDFTDTEGKNVKIYKMDNIWETYNKEKFDKLCHILCYYADDGLPF